MNKSLLRLASWAATLGMLASSMPVNAATVLDNVTVTGTVTSALSFAIVSDSDVAVSTSTCDFGTLAPNVQSNCYYRLRIATNAANGYHARINATTTFTNGTDEIPVMDDTAMDGDEPEYGFAVTPSTDGGYLAAAWTEASTSSAAFTDPAFSAVPVGATSTDVFSYYDGAFDSYMGDGTPDTAATNRVHHAVIIFNGQPQGNYTQGVWWDVTTTP